MTFRSCYYIAMMMLGQDLMNLMKKMFDEYVEKGGKLREFCINCRYCERKCPQHLQIRQELDKVEALV